MPEPKSKPKSSPKSKSKSPSKSRPPASSRPATQALLAPALALSLSTTGRLRTKLSGHLGDPRALNRACVQAVAELVDGSMDEAVILRGTMWLYDRTETDAVTVAEARAAEADARYRNLLGNVKDLFEASRQPAGRIQGADVDADADTGADLDVGAETGEAEEGNDAEDADADADTDVDEAIELQAELLGTAPVVPAAPAPVALTQSAKPAGRRWVYDAKTGLNHCVPDDTVPPGK